MSFEAAVKAWDGKSTGVIQQIYARFSTDPTFVEKVIRLAADADAQVGATWLLKKYLDSGNELDVRAVTPLLQNLGCLEHWAARLHLLQSLPAITIPARYRSKSESFVRDCLDDQNKFVRAWAYNAFYELARQFPQYRVEVSQLLDAALAGSEPASVKARVRKCLFQGF
jgi:hypothetical protein